MGKGSCQVCSFIFWSRWMGDWKIWLQKTESSCKIKIAQGKFCLIHLISNTPCVLKYGFISQNLLEAQFDGNIKFKNEINKVTSDELRLQPLGKDIQGRRYWHQLDDDCNLRVYREDLDEETWDLVSRYVHKFCGYFVCTITVFKNSL